VVIHHGQLLYANEMEGFPLPPEGLNIESWRFECRDVSVDSSTLACQANRSQSRFALNSARVGKYPKENPSVGICGQFADTFFGNRS